MTIFDMPNYLWITILGMILLTVFYTLVLNKWFQSAIITFVVLAVLAFLYQIFKTFHINHCLICRILRHNELNHKLFIWYFSRNWRKNRRKIKLEKRFANMMMKSHFVVIININFSTLLPSYLKQSCFISFLSLFLLI